MGFIDNNINFIKQKLRSEMKGLSPAQKKDKYNGLRSETRKRLKRAYIETSDNSVLYKEAFEILYDLEGEYLLYNLFFESDVVDIVNTLKSAGQINDIELEDKGSFCGIFLSFIKEKNKISEQDLKEFLLEEFQKIIPDIHFNDYENKVVHAYSNYLKYEDDKDILRSFLLFAKVWIYLLSRSPNSNTKKIVFYSKINTFLEGHIITNSSKYFYDLIKDIENFFSEILPDVHVPLLNNDISMEDDPICIKHMGEFMELLKDIRQINSLSAKDSYLTLLEHFIRGTHCNDHLIITAKEVIKKKIIEFQILDKKEIQKINELELNESGRKVKKYLFERSYLFEL